MNFWYWFAIWIAIGEIIYVAWTRISKEALKNLEMNEKEPIPPLVYLTLIKLGSLAFSFVVLLWIRFTNGSQKLEFMILILQGVGLLVAVVGFFMINHQIGKWLVWGKPKPVASRGGGRK